MPFNESNDVAHGSNEEEKGYSIPSEAQKVFQKGILDNPLIASTLPKAIHNAAKTIRFEGSDQPSIPINWRFAESISALKGLEAAMVNILLQRKYGMEPQDAIINTSVQIHVSDGALLTTMTSDHAQLFFMSILLNTIDPTGEVINAASTRTPEGKAAYEKYFKNCDLHDHASSIYRIAATNIYQCKDGRYFHIHGSLNPEPTQDSVGVPHHKDVAISEQAYAVYEEKVAQIDSSEMQRLASDKYKQAGTICWTTDEFKASEHGKANAHVGLFEIEDIANKSQSACWWPNSPETSARRPLAGLKVLDLTRIIAAPAMTRGLAELGASVMRVTSDKITDMSTLHLDLNWGKWNSHLDFREETSRAKLRELILDADVVVQGYRPDVLNKFGLSTEDLMALTKDRERGLIVVRENCYGWHGPWAYRSGWQQISDACCGVSMEFGRAMGLDEPVTPVFPNSDFCTGTAGVIAILNAILRRGAQGGSYKVDVS